MFSPAPVVRGSGESGGIYLAEPLDACTQLNNKVINDSSSSFALIIRGGCHFDEKVRNAQNAGFKAAVIYNNEDYGPVSASNVFTFINLDFNLCSLKLKILSVISYYYIC